MPDDRMRDLFEEVSRLQVTVPAAELAVARAQRRRRGRLQVSVVAWTVALAAGFGAPQAAGSLAGGGQNSPGDLTVRTVTRSASYPEPASRPPSPRPDTTARHAAPEPLPTQPPGRPAVSRTAAPGSPRFSETRISKGSVDLTRVLPPRGSGPLLLGLDSAGTFVMTRLDAAGAPVPLRGLQPAPAGAQPVLVTNPAGGWLVTVTAGRPAPGAGVTRLALVTVTGRSELFGPKYVRDTVASAAVSPDASRVALALAGPSGLVRLAVLPMPGHHTAARSWRIPAGQANLVTALSWAPDGRHLSYIAGRRAGTQLAGGPVTLDTASRAPAAPAESAWQTAPASSAWQAVAAKAGPLCAPQAAAWLGSSGEYAVLEACPAAGTEVLQTANPRTGAAAGRAVVVAGKPWCGPAALDPSADGKQVLISACGLHVDEHGAMSAVPGGLTAAALAGLPRASRPGRPRPRA